MPSIQERSPGNDISHRARIDGPSPPHSRLRVLSILQSCARAALTYRNDGFEYTQVAVSMASF